MWLLNRVVVLPDAASRLEHWLGERVDICLGRLQSRLTGVELGSLLLNNLRRTKYVLRVIEVGRSKFFDHEMSFWWSCHELRVNSVTESWLLEAVWFELEWAAHNKFTKLKISL